MARLAFMCLTFIFTFCIQVLAGPFGIDAGTPLDQLESSETDSKRQLKSVPKPHPSFDTYFAWGSGETGVCLVMALSKPYKNDAYGVLVRSDFEKFKAGLIKKYGNTKFSIDRLAQGSIWDDSKYWTMSIYKNERFFGVSWELMPSEETDRISQIELQVLALKSSTSIIKLFYKFDNFEACKKAMDDEADSSF